MFLRSTQAKQEVERFYKIGVTNILSSYLSRKNPFTRGASNGQGESLTRLLSTAENSDTDKPLLTQRLAKNVPVWL